MIAVNEEKCVGYGNCMPSCPEDALWAWGVCQIDSDKCGECILCIERCPVDALEKM